MKTLVINGSPKGEKSNTFRITKSFLEGMQEAGETDIEILDLSKAEINHCLGCFTCWTKTPGKCVFKDDMQDYLQKYIEADLIIWSFPLYYFSMPSKIKAFMDRLLPSVLPFMAEENGQCGHPPRYDLSHQHYMLISGCGFYEVEKNYAALLKQFDILYHERLTTILCGESELMRVTHVQNRTSEYLTHVRQAGVEYVETGNISSHTEALLKEYLFSPDVFVKMADAEWEINDEAAPEINRDRSMKFIHQMAAVYNPSLWQGNDIILEMHFTDIDKTYQLCMGQEQCSVRTEEFVPYTTRIETTFETWNDISDGKINGAEAMMKNLYRVKGNFDTMLKMDDYFGTSRAPETDQSPDEKKTKTNMTLLLAPWIILWVLLPINVITGAIAGIAAASIIPLLGFHFKLTIYEKINIPLVSVIGIMAMQGIDTEMLVWLSYLLFGLVWLVSGLLRIPLTAHYSVNDYGGDEFMANPLFIKTNRILTVMWGLVFLLCAGTSTLLMRSTLSNYTGLFNSLATAVMGAFTAWFARWYPARVARG